MWSEKVPSQQPSAISDVFYLHLLCLIILASTGVFLNRFICFCLLILLVSEVVLNSTNWTLWFMYWLGKVEY